MKTFSELNLIDPLQRSLAEQNYETPTAIQAQTIPAALEGADILGCAQTGTGKTASFALPILNELGQQKLKPQRHRPLALVVAPTRELAIQIGESFATYGKHLRIRTAQIYGGVNQRKQVRELDRGVHILVATPGRLIDLMSQGFIQLDCLEMFVLDEADRMLDMGFLPDLKRIIAALPKDRQSLFFSATLPPNIVTLANELLYEPVKVNVTPKRSSVKKIDQRVVFVEKSQKRAFLQRVLSGREVDRALVFTRTKRGANQLAEKLTQAGMSATAIHGNKSQAARQRALDAFRKRRVSVLVATDVAARGIDIDGVTHVVNFDMPVEPESYVHRIGRTGRAGAQGVAISLCTAGEQGELRAIERLIGHRVPTEGELPKGGERTAQSRPPRHRNGSRPGGPHTGGARNGAPRTSDAQGGANRSGTDRAGANRTSGARSKETVRSEAARSETSSTQDGADKRRSGPSGPNRRKTFSKSRGPGGSFGAKKPRGKRNARPAAARSR